MQFWKLSTKVLATLLAVVSASGPTDGDAIADPNSAVVKLTSDNFASFLEENPLVLTEFFAPWCGYCKMLGPEYSQAADLLKEKESTIKLAQIDCTEDEALCMEHDIKGYPTLKIIRDGQAKEAEDYQGPREAQGIVDYMIKQSLPAVQIPKTLQEFENLIKEQTQPFIVSIGEEVNEIFDKVASLKRKDFSFYQIGKELTKELKSVFPKVDLKKAGYLVVHPNQFAEEISKIEDVKDVDSLSDFINVETVPYFGDINRDTYMKYMTSPLPIAYYFYKTPEQKESISQKLAQLGKKFRGKLNIAGLDASLYGRHAEIVNMDPEILPFFAIHHINDNKKYGINQTEYPEGPSFEVIEKFVEDYFNDKLKPIIKSEPLPTEEEIKNQSVTKLVAHNYNDIVKDSSKDVFVKYYAPWCGHCKKLAPTWEELASFYQDSDVVIADVDHTNNDVDVPFEIQGYPTLLLFPANGEVDEKTGIRKPIVFEGQRELDSLLEFVKEKGALKAEGKKVEAEVVQEGEDVVQDHDEL